MLRLLLGFLLFLSPLFAELKVAENFPSLTLVNQFNDEVIVPRKDEWRVLISSEKKLSKAIQKKIQEKSKNFLEEKHLVYISDVHSLPSFLMRLFVLPTLKKLDFSVALLKEESDLPYQEGKVTVVTIKDAVVQKVEFMEVSTVF